MTKAERAHQTRLRDMGCAICARLGYETAGGEIHHVRKHGGLRRNQEMNVICLCKWHHDELHQNRRNYDQLYGIGEQELADSFHEKETV